MEVGYYAYNQKQHIPHWVVHVRDEISLLIKMIIDRHAAITVVSGIKIRHASSWDS